MNPTALTGVQIGVLTRFQVAFERGLLPRNRAAGYVQAVMPNHVQIALARVCAAFARQYPEWTASLFDEHFLKSQEVVSLLAELLTRRGRPDPAHLARQEALQPLYDRCALERIAAHTEAIRRQLEEEWPKALDEAAHYVQIVGSVSHSAIVTGDHNVITQGFQTFLGGDYVPLGDLYLADQS